MHLRQPSDSPKANGDIASREVYIRVDNVLYGDKEGERAPEIINREHGVTRTKPEALHTYEDIS